MRKEDFLGQVVCFQLFFILFQLTKNISLNSQSEEIELINHFSSFKRKKLLKFKSKKRRRSRRDLESDSDEDWSHSSQSSPSESSDNDDDDELGMVLRKRKKKQMRAKKKVKEKSKKHKPDMSKMTQAALVDSQTFESSLAIPSDLEEVLLGTSETNEYLNQRSVDAFQSAVPGKETSSSSNRTSSATADENSKLADFLLKSTVFDETANDVIREISAQPKPKPVAPPERSEPIEVGTHEVEIIKLDPIPRKKRGRKRKLLPNGELPPQKVRKKIKSSKKHFWDDSETFYLVVGVELYGRGKWSRILHEFHKKFKNRTCMNLKDKYRNLENSPEELSVFEKKAKELIEKANKKYNMD